MKRIISGGVAPLILLVFTAVLVPGIPAAAHDGQGATVSARYDSLDSTVLTFTIDAYSSRTISINGKEHLLLSLPHTGFVWMDRSGHPQLPAICQSVMLPDEGSMEVRVLDGTYTEIENVEVAPYRGPIVRSVDPASVEYVFGDTYEKDAWFPEDPARLREPYILRDVRGAVVEACLFQYNPAKKILRVYDRLEIEVTKTGPGGRNTIDRAVYGHKPDRSFEHLYQNLFVNYSGNRTDPPSEDGDLLVICHGPFMAAMQPFVAWKNSIGISTSIVDVATIGNNPTAIGNYIEQLYNATNLAFVLLVGDYSEMKSPKYQYGVSDPSYSTISYDWYPDLFIGRFSAQSENHVNTQVERTLQYEQEGHDVSMGGWNAKAMGIASNQGPGHYGEYDDEHEDLIRDELLAYGFTDVDRIYDPFGTKAMTTAGLNDGRRVVNYTGHGGTTGWGNGGGYSNSDVNKLTNVGMLPFISSVACNGGDFDYSTCFGEAWLRATDNGKPTGAIASYNSSIGQYWDEPMYGQGNHGHNNQYGAAERFWMEINFSVCACWFGGGCIMMDICGNSGRDMFMTWNCFGDPSLRLTGQPGEQTLITDGWAVPLDTPVDIHFTVCPGVAYAGHKYLLLGGLSGTWPGTALPGGVTIPLNFDFLTYYIMANPNTPVFQQFMGLLDGNGEAISTFSTNGLTPFDPRLKGVKLYFSAVIWTAGQKFEMATNAKTLTIVE